MFSCKISLITSPQHSFHSGGRTKELILHVHYSQYTTKPYIGLSQKLNPFALLPVTSRVCQAHKNITIDGRFKGGTDDSAV